ncbi:nucleolar protein dao-5-like [Cololabis saira]|uniref:nucleolar protein dao-5-like n=1 Tax=Cololabis saira TaxID=129043 RepID=UPI002AD2452A|nr:nucleolar protein dao-5-like [Cololabis saira]
MEACMMKPEVKKKPKPPKPPPKPVEVKTKQPERPEKPTPVMSYQHIDAMQQQDTREKRLEAPRVPLRPTEKSSRETEQPEAAVDEAESKQNNQSVLSGMFRLSKKEKLPTFTSYVAHTFDEEEKTDGIPAKQGFLKGVMKGLHLKSSPKGSRDPSPDPGAEETRSEKEQSAKKKKQEKNAEAKQAKGDFLQKSDPPVDETSTQDNLSAHSELSASNDSLSEHKESRGIFSGMFRRSSKPADALQTDTSPQTNLSSSSDSLSETHSKDKGFFSGILRKSPKIHREGSHEQSAEPLRGDLSASADNLLERKEKGGLFGLLRKTPKTTSEDNLLARKEISGSSGSLSETSSSKEKELQSNELSGSTEGLTENNRKEKGGIFNGIFKKPPKPAEAAQTEEDVFSDTKPPGDNENEKVGGLFGVVLRKTQKASGEKTETPDREAQSEPSASSEDLSENIPTKEKELQSNELSGSSEGLAENNKKEKGGIFNGIFKKPPKPAEAAQTEEDVFSDTKPPGGNENEKAGGLFGVLLRKTPKASGEKTETTDREAQSEPSAGSEDLSENIPTKEKNIFSNMFKKQQKPAEGATAEMESEENTEKELLGSSENLMDTTGPKEKKGGLAALFKRSSSFENLLEEGNSGGLASIFKKSPKPAPRTTTSQHPLSDSNQLSDSSDSLTEAGKEDVSAEGELSGSSDNLSETSSNKTEKKVGFSRIFRRTPKTLDLQDGEGEDSEVPEGGGLRRRRTIKKKRRVVSFRVKKTLPRIPKLNSSSQSSIEMPIIEETLELQDMNAGQDQESTVEVQPVEMAAYPTEENAEQMEQETDELMEWWNTVKGWNEWNENSDFQEEDEEMAMEQAADRVYMAARLFVHLFNQRGASLQHRILELLALADTADEFHKKTVSAAVGGRVASVAGSITTITGLILAPFTFGASIIVTAVGIGVATAGSITSATANLTDTVHSNMGRKKVEKMIQGYQEEIKDIRECMEFVQEGMDTLQELDFEKYTQSAAKKAMNHNIKHVMKEGGRAGKALMINTDKLIRTVQVLSAASGAAKAVQVISVSTGVMSALFLALDVFFLAKESHDLRKGAKTKFAAKIRDVCKDLQDGLLELNKVKVQLQKTMDGIEVEEYEEIEEVEVEVEDDFESDPKKLAELEQELDLIGEKLDKKDELEQKSKEPEREFFKFMKKKKDE